MHRRSLLRLSAGLGLLPSWAVPLAAAGKVLKVVNGFPAGGVVDIVTRRIGEGLVAARAAQAVVVDNRVGAAGRIASAVVKAAPADGSTLLLTPDTVLSLYPFIYSKLDYDSFRDFLPVGTAAATTDAFAVGPMVSSAVKTMRDFIDWARANPQQANFGSPGAGSPLHLLGALIAREAGIDLRHVAYRGAAPGVADLVGGQVAAMVAPTGNFLAFQQSGKLRVLGTSGTQRTPFTPNTPTFAEQRMADDYPAEEQWFGLFAPAGTASSVILQLNQGVAQALKERSVVDALAAVGMIPRTMASGEMTDSLRRQTGRWARVVRKVGFTPES